MKRKRTLLVCAMCGLLAAMAVGTAGGSAAMAPTNNVAVLTAFSWDDDESTNQSWSFAANWDVGSGYPDGNDDDALIPCDVSDLEYWSIELVDAAIRDLDIEKSVVFSGASTQLSVEGVLTIEPCSGDDVSVTLVSGKIKTTP